MCRYSDHNYKSHFVCVDCRRSFKAGHRSAQVCPECAQPATEMGRDFKPPRRNSRNQWRKIALFVENGVRFHSCGCAGPGPRPHTFAQTKTFLDKRRATADREHKARWPRAAL